ncbi:MULTISPECIES: hypothetical protein [Pasteurellaceae]|uniref:Uncharacterized protein n=2 Tax=Actinobacillus TaxID=713 RepID=A0ABT1WR62_ACTSU|nr:MULTISPECIES: hypothetical protein [Pasteurellaceae]AIJ31187.1 hypothetical protein ASU1_04595 [Actinobacillus suis ATCC 33415]AIZ79105.1 hypothetical protein ACEE_04830 [Actinobacillus equuli subsp. equuli]MCQ9628692.1 hypothetical protein [Actinobacillus suis]MCQ9631373.1 hypothetical protein [Actinobacillus suis]NNI17117.1 hypothetical protein [Pasteurella multocida]
MTAKRSNPLFFITSDGGIQRVIDVRKIIYIDYNNNKLVIKTVSENGDMDMGNIPEESYKALINFWSETLSCRD